MLWYGLELRAVRYWKSTDWMPEAVSLADLPYDGELHAKLFAEGGAVLRLLIGCVDNGAARARSRPRSTRPDGRAATRAHDRPSGGATPATIEYRRQPLWDTWVWLTAIVGLLTLEWVARRVRGLA